MSLGMHLELASTPMTNARVIPEQAHCVLLWFLRQAHEAISLPPTSAGS